MAFSRCSGFLAWVLTAAIFALDASGDVVVMKSGGRFAGNVTDTGDSYVVVSPAGSKMRLPKSAVQEVITTEALRSQFKNLQSTTNLSDDAHVAALAKFIAENGLSIEQQELLSSAYQVRRTAAKDSAMAWRALAKWCASYNLKDEEAACDSRANQLEFVTKLAEAGDRLERLEEVARWCSERKLQAELQQCVARQYEMRQKEAQTAEDHLRLAEWCRNWKMAPWREEQQMLAIRAAISANDLAKLEQMREALKSDAASPAVRQECSRAVYKARLKSAEKDAKALAELSIWCMSNSLKPEATEAEAAALKMAPDDPGVRTALGYRKSGAGWVRIDLSIVRAYPSYSAPVGGGYTVSVQPFTMTRTGPGQMKSRPGPVPFLVVILKCNEPVKSLEQCRIVDAEGNRLDEKMSVVSPDPLSGMFPGESREAAAEQYGPMGGGLLSARIRAERRGQVMLLFSGKWSSLEGLLLEGLGRRVPLAEWESASQPAPTKPAPAKVPAEATAPKNSKAESDEGAIRVSVIELLKAWGDKAKMSRFLGKRLLVTGWVKTISRGTTQPGMTIDLGSTKGPTSGVGVVRCQFSVEEKGLSVAQALTVSGVCASEAANGATTEGGYSVMYIMHGCSLDR
jgi:hypothetical protein